VSQDATNDPWKKHYRARGQNRPPKLRVTKAGRALPPPDTGKTKTDAGKPSAPAPSPGTTPAPASEPKIIWDVTPEIEMVTAADLQRAENDTKTKRRREALVVFRLIGWAIAAAAAVVACFEVANDFLNSEPSAADLERRGREVAELVRRRFDSPAQPIAIASVREELFERSRGGADYDIVVVLALREPLYGPASSNGAQAYLQMQQSVADAHKLALQLKLYGPETGLDEPPAMPELLDLTHRAGERIVAKVPLVATRRGVTWKLEPHPERLRLPPTAFSGSVLTPRADEVILFNSDEGRARAEEKVREGEAFVRAVMRLARARQTTEGTPATTGQK
jgi:hypothetical protein